MTGTTKSYDLTVGTTAVHSYQAKSAHTAPHQSSVQLSCTADRTAQLHNTAQQHATTHH